MHSEFRLVRSFFRWLIYFSWKEFCLLRSGCQNREWKFHFLVLDFLIKILNKWPVFFCEIWDGFVQKLCDFFKFGSYHNLFKNRSIFSNKFVTQFLHILVIFYFFSTQLFKTGSLWFYSTLMSPICKLIKRLFCILMLSKKLFKKFN